MNRAHICMEAEGEPCCCFAAASDMSTGVCPALPKWQSLYSQSHPALHF